MSIPTTSSNGTFIDASGREIYFDEMNGWTYRLKQSAPSSANIKTVVCECGAYKTFGKDQSNLLKLHAHWCPLYEAN